MTPTTEFPKLMEIALAEIQSGTRELVERYALANYPGFEIDEPNARLVFVNGPNRLALPAQMLGYHVPDRNEWQWAWSDPSLSVKVTRSARAARSWGEANEIALLARTHRGAVEDGCWRLAAFAARLSGWPALYRCPFANRYLYVAFGAPAA
jgi:hypothetical protein